MDLYGSLHSQNYPIQNELHGSFTTRSVFIFPANELKGLNMLTDNEFEWYQGVSLSYLFFISTIQLNTDTHYYHID